MSFDRIARSYRLLETIAFGNTLQRARSYWIDKIPAPKQVLIVGEGNGRFLCELLRRHPQIEIDCVDESSQMLKLARKRVFKTFAASEEGVRFIHENILTWSPASLYDLIVTHFFLDCFPRDQVKAIVDKLARTAAPNAAWLLADFAIPPKGMFVRLHTKLWLRAMYCFFRGAAGIGATELVDPSEDLRKTGFVCEMRVSLRAEMVKSELWQRSLSTR